MKETIDTEIWEPIEGKEHLVHYVGQRKIDDIFNEVKEHLKSLNLIPDDYFEIGCSYKYKNISDEFPKCARIACFAVYGGSEGIYLHVDGYIEDGKVETLFLGKTLDESDQSMDKMYKAAAECAKILRVW